MVRMDQNSHRKNMLKSFKGIIRKNSLYIREISKLSKQKITQVSKKDGQLTNCDKETADVLCETFKQVLVVENTDDPKIIFWGKELDVSETLIIISFSQQIVENKLSSLDENKSAGPDGFYPLVLKRCANELSLPLSIIFQKSYDTGCLPEHWKLANITPIFEKR